MTKPGRIRLDREGHVAMVTLDRPGAHNALTLEMYEQLGDICDGFAADADLRAVIFRGAGGRAFSAGTDIAVLSAFATAADGIAYERSMDGYLDRVAAVPVPTVAVVEGLAVGGGLNIAAACDIRMATKDARFGVPIARTLGGCLSMSNFAVLVDTFGSGRARRMLMLGDLLGAEEALACGFLARVADRGDLDTAVNEVTETLVANAPITQRVSKAALARLRRTTVPDGDDLIAACYGSDDFGEGVRSFFDKRRPTWRGK